MTKDGKKLNTKKVLPIALAALLAVVILFGAVFGIITLVREMNAVVSYNGITADRGVVSYLASSYKQTYLIQNKNAADNEVYWGTEVDEGVTNGDVLRELTENYIRSVIVRAYLFDINGSLTSSDREFIDENVKDVLSLKADGSEERFNKEAEPMGFTYNDFKAATELLYKAERAREKIYGKNGEALSTQSADAKRLCTQFYKTYSHVRVLYIRRNDRFKLDENGQKIVVGNSYEMVELSPEEKLRRHEVCEEISRAINDGQMTLSALEEYYRVYNDDPDNAYTGYYLSEGSAYTESFRKDMPILVEEALSLEPGQWGKAVEEDGGNYCFIYREQTSDETGYADDDLSIFFRDFYLRASAYHFDQAVGELLSEVDVKESYYGIDPLRLLPNWIFFIS